MAFDPDSAELDPLRSLERPAPGWIRAVREASGVSAGELGRRLGVSRQLPLQFERAEAADTITLKSLRAVAAALNCELVYALVPRTGRLEILAQSSVAPVQTTAQPGEPRAAARKNAPPSANPHFCD